MGFCLDVCWDHLSGFNQSDSITPVSPVKKGVSLNQNEQQVPEPFSGVVRLSRQNEVLFEQGYNFAPRAERIPNQTNTRFQTASGSKVFSSVAACKLIELGKISMDACINDCLDVKFPNFDPNITVRHLLTHRSGITSYFEEDIDPDYEALWREYPMYGVRDPKDFLGLNNADMSPNGSVCHKPG